MADPQNTLGDLLGKLGISLGDSESQRQDMIRRLKTVKDPEERDRIIWALAGQKKEGSGYRPSPGSFGRKPKAERRQAPAGMSSVPSAPPSAGPFPKAPPSLPTGPAGQQLRITGLVNYIVPILFLFFGVSNIARAIEAFRAGADKEDILVQFLVGIGFIIFAAAGLFSRKVKKAAEKSRERV
jgi:hypothetical protein